jgi:ferredoxin
MPKFIIEIDKEKCIGCGSCNAICPENFELDEDGKAEVLNPEVEELSCNQLAAENCPVGAITVTPAE